MKFKDKMLLGFILLGLWLLMVLHVFSDTAHSAESPTGRLAAIVSFEDAEHLVALQDSVVGVCDTVNAVAISGTVGNIGNFTFYQDLEEPIVTCRELVCVTARWPEIVADTGSKSYDGFFDDIFPTKIIPGTAIINYRRVKQ